MPKGSSSKFKEILNYDDYKYVLKSMVYEPLGTNFPNTPRTGTIYDSTVISFEHKGSNYRLLSNDGDPDCNHGTFGALFDSNDAKVVDLKSFGDCETKIDSLKIDDVKMDDDLQRKLKPYLRFFNVVMANQTEFEYLVFKILVECKCFGGIEEIDNPYCYMSDNEDDEDSEEEEEEDEEIKRELEEEEDEEVIQSINKIHL